MTTTADPSTTTADPSTRARRPLVFLDVETTGLDPDRHDVWEIAYAVDDGPVITAVVNHGLSTADPAALAVNGHHDRCPGCFTVNASTFEAGLRDALVGAVMVGANPTFDAAMLLARWELPWPAAPWHYRLLDVEAYAAGVLGWEQPRGLAAIADHLGIDAPDHTAGQDVTTLRAVWSALRDAQSRPTV